MRIVRVYSMHQEGGSDLVRADYRIECEETRFCEDAACEARHDDPSTKWDTRHTYMVATGNGLERATRVLAALRDAESKPAYDPNAVTLTLPYEEAAMLLMAAEVGEEGAEENLDPEDTGRLDRAMKAFRAAIEPSAVPVSSAVATYTAFNAQGHAVQVTIPESEK